MEAASFGKRVELGSYRNGNDGFLLLLLLLLLWILDFAFLFCFLDFSMLGGTHFLTLLLVVHEI